VGVAGFFTERLPTSPAHVVCQGTTLIRGGHHGLPTWLRPVDKRFVEEKDMNTRPHTKLVHEGQYVAEVDVSLIETDEAWSPYLSLEDANKLDDVRDALRRGDIRRASQMSRVYVLTRVAG
jgi:hypothetical protein